MPIGGWKGPCQAPSGGRRRGPAAPPAWLRTWRVGGGEGGGKAWGSIGSRVVFSGLMNNRNSAWWHTWGRLQRDLASFVDLLEGRETLAEFACLKVEGIA